MKNKFVEEIIFTESVTEYLQLQLNRNIKNVLNILDATVEDAEKKRLIRKAILQNFNEFYVVTCRVMTKIQDE